MGRHLGYGEETVVAASFLALELFAFDNADEACADGNAWKSRLIHEKKNVDGVTVRRFRAGQKPEIVGEGHSGGQNFLDAEDVLFVVVSELVAAAFRCLDDDLDQAFGLVDGLEQDGIAQALGDLLWHE